MTSNHGNKGNGFWISCHETLRLRTWWINQAWLLSTEILMGFLAVAYFGKASPATVATALALAYASSGATSAWIGRTGRKAAVTMATMGIGMGFLAVTAQTHAIFATSAMAGILLGFRDQQTIQTLAWMPIRAIKKGGSSMQTLIASSIFSSIVMATGLFIAGTLIDRAPSAQAWIGLSATAILVPMAVLDIPGRRRRRTTQIPDLNVKQRERWLVTLTAAYHAATLTCHRIFIPLALLAIARQIGIQGHNLAFIGLCLGIMGALANFLPIERMTGAHPMITGARGAALSWLLIALGASPWLRPPVGAACFIAGWILLQIFARIHMTNFLEELRANATGRGHHRIHPHRRALRKAMIGKAFGTCAGCVAIAMTPHAMTPVVLAAMAGICLLVTEGEPMN